MEVERAENRKKLRASFRAEHVFGTMRKRADKMELCIVLELSETKNAIRRNSLLSAAGYSCRFSTG